MFLQASPSLIKSRKPTDAKLDYSHITVIFSLLGIVAVVSSSVHLLLIFEYKNSKITGKDSCDQIK